MTDQIKITVTTATKLTPDQQREAKALIATRAGKAEVVFAIDPNVLGGIKVDIGNQTFDATLEGQLKRLALSANACTIVSAIPLTAKQLDTLTTAIQAKQGSVVIKTEVRASALGGIKIIIGSKEYDRTIAGKLLQLESQTIAKM